LWTVTVATYFERFTETGQGPVENALAGANGEWKLA
jgi:hypothetical protein